MLELFPDGIAENLVTAYNGFVVQAMVDLQAAVACLRYGNTDFYPQCSTYFNCGLTVLPQPNGQVLHVCTIGKQLNQGQTPGTQIGTSAVVFPMVNLVNGVIVTTPVSGTLCSIPATGLYTIEIAQTNQFATLYPAGAPQYIQVQISYTDSSGNPQTVQPAPLCHLSDANQSGSLTIDCLADTNVTYSINPYNVPQQDGTISVNMTLTSGGTGASNDDWCSKVYYQQVQYDHIERLVKANRGCSQTNNIWVVANAIVAQLFGNWREKRRYCPPTDLGFENLPPLPPGFHYPQTSTDAGGRSRSGVYAIKHGRIYIAPWIESTESVIVEWNGVKTNWADTDLVTDDPQFEKAVRLKVGIDHYVNYEDNAARLAEFKKQYYGEAGAPGALRVLINDCRNKMRQRSNWELGSTDGDAAGGVGITTGTTSSTGTYYSAAQSYTASCPTGQLGNSVTVSVPAGRFSSSLSQADADAQAMAAAQSQAQAQLSCTSGSVFKNVAQSYTAVCQGETGAPAPTGSSATVTVPAGTYQSTISQAMADAAALQAATIQAQAQLACTFFNSAQTATVTCADSSQQSATVPAGAYTSTLSQADADSQAMAQAQTLATNQCSLPANAYNVGNSLQLVPYNLTATTDCGLSYPFAGTVTIPPNTYIGQATPETASAVKLQLNQQAQQAAQQQIAASLRAFTRQKQLSCYDSQGNQGH